MVRRFEVGAGNPDFRPIGAISRYLPSTIMHGEDFAFYHHHGFYPEAFHKSLVENIKTGGFQRGASTLSMQLVKNVFLNQDKTMARKLEEILIVWLIENNRLTSKSRMFEVYMNIIEWGPDVYGITEAARFYFSKDPSALTLGECIFLTYIIPNPRYLQNYFTGLRLKSPFYEFFSNAVRRLLQRRIISVEDAIRANPNINFRGPVVDYLTR
jgi:membrane peptidoglycan carboxypeptidase